MLNRLMKISKRIGLILNGRWFLRQLIVASIRPFDFHFFFLFWNWFSFSFRFLFSVDFCCCCWYCLFQFDRNALALHILSLYRSSFVCLFLFRSLIRSLALYLFWPIWPKRNWAISFSCLTLLLPCKSTAQAHTKQNIKRISLFLLGYASDLTMDICNVTWCDRRPTNWSGLFFVCWQLLFRSNAFDLLSIIVGY